MDHRKLTGAVIVNLQNVFDTVELSIILNNASSYGISSADHFWVKVN